MHLTIDGFGGDWKLLGDDRIVESFLNTCPGEIGMTKISEPYVMLHQAEKEEDWGITGFVLIAESHIAIHTYPDRGLIWADIFSCREFETLEVTEALIRAFDLDDVQTTILKRGLEYPNEAIDAQSLRLDT